jgi:serine/threonine protein phosphatase PrpC
LSRAIGDFEFKKSAELPPEQQIVTAFPDVEIHDISEDDEFLVVACDGMLVSGWVPTCLLTRTQVSGIANLLKQLLSLFDGALLQSRISLLFVRT